MPGLDKISIRGIRSFSPSETNVVEFNTPLTLIVGPNGSGKTTIIECLKYITTGNLPPNSKGGAFIFDPQLANEIDVKGEIKLKFINNPNESIICTRSMQVSQKNNKITQKTLESTLIREFPGKSTIISSKLAEVDKEISEHFGTSNSILDNVIFYHQEESTWPLSEPKVLKDKLDEIFDSTRYLKAHKGFKDSKRTIGSDIKLKEQGLLFLYKEKTKRDELLRTKNSLEDSITAKKSLKKNIQKNITEYQILSKNYNRKFQFMKSLNKTTKFSK